MDILLNPNTNDVIFVNGDAPVTQSKQDIVAQRLKITLQTFLGEWFLNLDTGIPYFQQILTKIQSKTTVDAIFQDTIVNDPDVIEMVSYQSILDVASRTFTLSFAVRVSAGDVIPIDFTLFVGAA